MFSTWALPVWLLAGAKKLLTTLFAAVKTVGDAIIAGLLSGIGALLPNAGAQLASVGTLLGQINHFFPLSETVALAATLGALWVLVWGYKVVKSWIPTVSG